MDWIHEHGTYHARWLCAAGRIGRCSTDSRPRRRPERAAKGLQMAAAGRLGGLVAKTRNRAAVCVLAQRRDARHVLGFSRPVDAG
jgi:hypothetical protein